MESQPITKESLLAIYNQCLKLHLVKSKTEFAELIGCHRSVITAALNGDPKYLTESLLGKATRALEDHSITMNNSGNATGNTQNNYTTATQAQELSAIVDRLVGEMAAQRESYERIIIAALQRGQNG